MKVKLILSGICMLINQCLLATDFNVHTYGAIGDSITNNTIFINKAITDCSENGGGRVVIPPGKYISGTIILKNNVELHLSKGAHLIASDNYYDFPIQSKAKYRSLKDISGWSSLIFAVDAENISITGDGIIDGKGKGRKGRFSNVPGDCNGRVRNILFISCSNVKVSGITMFNSPIWNQHYLDCENVIVDKIRVYNHCNGNNDGIDIDGCRNFILSNSIIDSDDDGIVLKSTGNKPCEDIIINNCIVSSFANAIKCGTESIGGFKNINISNCIIKPSNNKGERIIKSTPSGITGISLEIVDGGIMNGVTVNNILIEGTECPLYIRLANRDRRFPGDTIHPMGKISNIKLSNITAFNTGNFCSSITGIEDNKIDNVHLDNIVFYNNGGLKEGNFFIENHNKAKRHDLSNNISFDKYLATYKDVKEDAKGYPQPTVWGNLPSYGLFIRNVKSIVVNNSCFTTINNEPRTPFIAVNIDRLIFKNITVNDHKRNAFIFDNVREHFTDSLLYK